MTVVRNIKRKIRNSLSRSTQNLNNASKYNNIERK
jgi:hypothetical protein